MNRPQKQKVFATILCDYPTLKPKQPLTTLTGYHSHVTLSGLTLPLTFTPLSVYHLSDSSAQLPSRPPSSCDSPTCPPLKPGSKEHSQVETIPASLRRTFCRVAASLAFSSPDRCGAIARGSIDFKTSLVRAFRQLFSVEAKRPFTSRSWRDRPRSCRPSGSISEAWLKTEVMIRFLLAMLTMRMRKMGLRLLKHLALSRRKGTSSVDCDHRWREGFCWKA